MAGLPMDEEPLKDRRCRRHFRHNRNAATA
jgi:hypothetical protein